MKIKSILTDIEATPDFKEWRKKSPNAFLAHIFMIVDKKGIKWQAGYCDKDDMITTIEIEDGKIKIHAAEKAFKKPGTTIRPLLLDDVRIDVLDCLEKMHDIQHEKYPAELPVKKIVVLQTIEEGQVYNVTYVTTGLKTLNIKMDSVTGNVRGEKLEQVFRFA